LKMALCFEIFISGVKFPFPLWSDSGESHSEALAETSHRTNVIMGSHVNSVITVSPADTCVLYRHERGGVDNMKVSAKPLISGTR